MNKRIALAMTWTLLVLIGCWIPAWLLPVSEASLSMPGWGIPKDKALHFAMFAGFAYLWLLALGRPFRFLPVLTAAIALVAISELGQALPFIGRNPDLPDAIADLVGVGFAAGFVLLIATMRRGLPSAQAAEPAPD